MIVEQMNTLLRRTPSNNYVSGAPKTLHGYRTLCVILLLLFAILANSHAAELLVYEPFDYKPLNNEVFGRLEGRNGGKGFAAPWKDTGGRDNEGYASVYDERGNPEDLYGGIWGKGKLDWDGVVDNLPTMGGYVGGSDWEDSDRLNSQRTLARSAGDMAKDNGGVLWLSAVWHFPSRSFFAPVGIALTSKGGGIKGRGHTITNGGDGIGAGNGRAFRNGRKRLNAMCWQKGNDVSFTPVNDLKGDKDYIILLKYEFGETDKVSAWCFTEEEEMLESVFNEKAMSSSTQIDEFSLDTLAFSTTHKENAVDEFRIGTTFQSVISGEIKPRQEVKMTKFQYEAKGDSYYLEWTSNPGETYGVYLKEDAGGFQPCVAAAVKADTEKGVTSFGPFANPKPGNKQLQFEVGFPDLTQPVIDRAWGNATTVSLRFTEAMLPGTTLNPANYTVRKDDNSTVAVKAAKFHPGENNVMLTLAKGLEFNASYRVTTSNLTDRANLELVEQSTSFHTWDNNPKGVKVFILAGQSNMVGHSNYDNGKNKEFGGIGSLREYVKRNPTVNPGFFDEEGKWKPIDDMKFCWDRAEPGRIPRLTKGNMTVGYGADKDVFGPEYGFAWGVHAALKGEPVLIIKVAWGGKNLFTDYCSPSAASLRNGNVGPYYRQMMKSVMGICGTMGVTFPEFKGKGYQIAGFAWHQGFNDMLNPTHDAAYEDNMAMFIRDIRAEFGRPNLPFAIATTGQGGMAVTPEKRLTLAGQLAVADPKKHPEFAGTVFTVDSRPFQRTVEESPRKDGSHWHRNGETLWLIGKGMGDGIAKMLRGK